MTNIAPKIKTSFPRSLITMAVVAASVGFVTNTASANDYRNYSDFQNATYDYARVVDVKPVVETYQETKPVERCWDERVPARYNSTRDDRRYRNEYDRGYRNKSKTPEILGAILGGVVGNQVGKRGGGKARDVATVAGAVLGGSVGRDVKHKNSRQYNRDRHERARYSNRARYETVQRCEVKDSYVTKEQVVGYDVAYKYQGNVFHTQMDQHPGDKIKVKVTVDPV